MTLSEEEQRRPTLEQQRAQDAWQRAEGCSKDYMNLAKGLPALIMNSGLMQVMAFLHEKSSGAKNEQKKTPHQQLAEHLRAWLHQRCEVGEDFEPFMQNVMALGPREYQALTTEAFAWLKWLRQMAAARQGKH